MGLFSKKKKKDPGKAKEAASARAASAEKKQDTAGQETAVEKPVPERAKKTSEEYSEEMLSRSKQFWEYQNRFAFTKESVESVSSLRKLNEIRDAADRKFFELSMLEAGTEDCYSQMASGGSVKEEDKENYEIARARLETCKRLYSELLDSIEERKKTISNDPKLAKRNSIIERFKLIGKNTPMMQLLRKVRVFEDNPGYRDKPGKIDRLKAKVLGGFGMTEKDAEELHDEIKPYSEMKEGYDEAKESIGDFKGELKKLKDKKAGKPVEDEKEDPFDGMVDMVKNTVVLIKDTVEYVKNIDKMNSQNAIDTAVSIITKGLSTATDSVGKVVSLLTEFPFVGPVIGLVKNAISFFSEGYQLFMSRRRMAKLREQKKLLKARMLKRKKKYASDPELKSLYGFISEGKDGEAKLDRKKLGYREDRGMVGSGSDAREAMKSAAAEKQGSKRHLYYKAKEAESIEQYDEIKEAIHKHKNIRREKIIAIIQQGVDVAANISGFFTGIGTVVSSGIKAGNSVFSAGKTAFSWARNRYKSMSGDRRSEENKEVFRNKYAEHIYDNMAEVSQYLDGEGKVDLNKADAGQIRKIAESYDYAENMILGTSANMVSLIDAPSKEDLLDEMSKAFGAGE